MKSLVLATLLTMVAATSGAAQIPDEDHAGNPLRCDEQGRVLTMGECSILIPRGLSGCRPDGHGVLIPLGTRAEPRVIGVSGFSNASFTPNVEAELNGFVKFVLGSPGQYANAVEVRRASLSIHGVAAMRVVFKYDDPGSRRPMVLDRVAAMSPEAWEANGSPLYSYDVWLDTPAATYESDKKVFETFLENWRYEGSR